MPSDPSLDLPLPELRVLVAEDNPSNRAAARCLLERFGCRVEFAFDGREAVERVESGGFDLVLMDVQMPVMGGIEATRIIRERETERGTSRLGIVAMTADCAPEDRERCFAVGMDLFLAKPVSAGELLEALRYWSASRAVRL